MKKEIILIVMVTFLLVGCGVNKEKSNSLAMKEDIVNRTSETTMTTTTQDILKSTTKRTTRVSNFYTEVESDKKEKHKYTFVYKNLDECQKSGEELLPTLRKIHPEIVEMKCIYLKDDKNNRVWGVLFRTCSDPLAVCNFYY